MILLIIGLIWLAMSVFVDFNAAYLPDPLGLMREMVAELCAGVFMQNILVTIARVAAAVGVGAIAGVPIGLLCASSRIARLIFIPVIDFLRSIPTTLLFPVFIIFLGIGDMARTAIALYATFPIFAISAFVGALPRGENAGRREYLLVHARRVAIPMRLLAQIWDAVPSIVAGGRIAVSIALVLVVVTEMFFSSSSGAGWAAYQAYLAFAIDRMYAYILAIGMIGYLFNLVVGRLTGTVARI